MSTETTDNTPPLVPFINTDGPNAFLVGARCNNCETVFVGTREVCAKCTGRGTMEEVHLSETGKLYNFTIVHRSFPGTKTPFIDAIVDLDDGAHLKGTLLDVDPVEGNIPFDLPVKIVYREVVPVNAEGKSYLGYFFVPA